MPWPLVLGAIKEVDEGDREVVITAEVVVMEHLRDVAAGTVAGSTMSRGHSNGSTSRRQNNSNNRRQSIGSISSISRSNNHNSSIMGPGNYVKGADSLGTSQPIARHPCQFTIRLPRIIRQTSPHPARNQPLLRRHRLVPPFPIRLSMLRPHPLTNAGTFPVLTRLH